jgi:3-deoxy-D-manno-octulosonic-acid transferase
MTSKRRDLGMYLLYSVLTAVATLLLTPYFLVRSFRSKRYLQNLPERLGLRFPTELAAGDRSAPGAIWIHAVSVGEALAAVPLAQAVKKRFADRRLVVSTTTATGQALARERLPFADAIFYFPLDWRGPVRRALRAARPALVIIFETEIWPNFLREARRAGIPVVFVNGRISEVSFRRFTRVLRWSGGAVGGFLRRVLGDASLYLMQNGADARRLLSLGAPVERVSVIGNLKYDMTPPAAGPLVRWLEAEVARSRRWPVLVAGSVTAGEEPAVLEALAAVGKKWPDALLVLAPRKPERFSGAAELVEQAGWRVIRRSELALNGVAPSAPSAKGGELASTPGRRSVLLLDTIGELSGVYQIADAVFIGGSLEPAGGHNPLEPAAFGKTPVFGFSMDNFREIAGTLVGAGGAVQVRSGEELGAAWMALLADAERSSQMGRVAQELVERNRGATAASLERIAMFLPPAKAPE